MAERWNYSAGSEMNREPLTSRKFSRGMPDHEPTPASSYRPPPVQDVYVGDNTSSASLQDLSEGTKSKLKFNSTQHPRYINTNSNLFQDDNAFTTMGSRIMSIPAHSKHSLEEAIKTTLSPSNMTDFTEALTARARDLPMFPEVCEASICGIVRAVNGKYGTTLRELCAQFEKVGHTRRDSEIRDTPPENNSRRYDTVHQPTTPHYQHHSGSNVGPLPDMLPSRQGYRPQENPPQVSTQQQRVGTPVADPQPQRQYHQQQQRPRTPSGASREDPQTNLHYPPQLEASEQYYSNTREMGGHSALFGITSPQSAVGTPHSSAKNRRTPSSQPVQQHHPQQIHQPQNDSGPEISVDWNITELHSTLRNPVASIQSISRQQTPISNTKKSVIPDVPKQSCSSDNDNNDSGDDKLNVGTPILNTKKSVTPDAPKQSCSSDNDNNDSGDDKLNVGKIGQQTPTDNGVENSTLGSIYDTFKIGNATKEEPDSISSLSPTNVTLKSSQDDDEKKSSKMMDIKEQSGNKSDKKVSIVEPGDRSRSKKYSLGRFEVTPKSQQQPTVVDNRTREMNVERRGKLKVVRVNAPSDLPQGFQFEARVGDEIFMAKVPKGGVRKGQIFETSMGDVYDDGRLIGPDRVRTFRDMDAPPFRWRDELFDCCRHGFDHQFLWSTICCPHVALSQVMARAQVGGHGGKLLTLGSRNRVGSTWTLYFMVLGLHVCYGVYPLFFKIPDLELFLMATIPMVTMDVLLIIYFFYLVSKTRKILREEYSIPELRCNGCEDSCLAVFCTCCTIGQMGRHTADYETYRAYCCTDTGMAKHVEVKLPADYVREMD